MARTTAIKSAAAKNKTAAIKTVAKKGANKEVIKAAPKKKIVIRHEPELTTGQITSKCREFKTAIKAALASKDIKPKHIDVNYMSNGIFNVAFNGQVKVGGYGEDYSCQFDVSFDGKTINEVGYTAPYISCPSDDCETLDVIAKTTTKNNAVENFSKAIGANSKQHEEVMVYIVEQIKIVRQFNNCIALALNAFTKTKFAK